MKRFFVAIMAFVVMATLAPVAADAATQSPPENLTVTTTVGTATLDWDKPAGAAGYNVYRNNAYITTVDSPPYRDSTSAGVYEYYVTAFDASKQNHSSKSNVVVADTRSASGNPSPEPENTDPVRQSLGTPALNRIDTVRGAATLHFTEVPGATGYNVYRNDGYLTTVGGSPFRDQATPGNYTYYVIAFDDAADRNFSSKSNTVAADTTGTSVEVPTNPPSDRGQLATPSGLTTQLEDGQVTLEWDLSDSRIVGVNVYRDNQYMVSVNKPVTRWVDENGQPASTYYVQAYDDSGNYSEKSSRRQVGLRRAPLLRAGGWVGDVDRGVQLLWDKVEGAAGYNVYADGEFLASTGRSSFPSYKHVLSENGIYSYYVQAYDETGEIYSPKSYTAEARVGIAPDGNRPPSAPSNLRFERSGNEITLSWNESTDDFSVPTYELLGLGGSPVKIRRGTSYTLTQPSTVARNYWVRATDGVERSSWVSVYVGKVITGTEHGPFTWTFSRLRTKSTIDDSAQLKELVSALFAEYDPLTGRPGSESSQKRQYNYNRNIAWALLGVDAATNNQSCCGNLHLAFVWANLLSMMDDQPGPYKGGSASDREFYDSWNAATPEQRVEYLGFDVDQFAKAVPFMEAARVNLRIQNDYDSARFDQIVGIVFGLALSAMSVGLLPPGTSIFVQGAVGGGVAGGVSTLIITGDFEDAIKAAGEGAIWGGVAAWADELTGLNKVLANVTLAAAKAEINGGDPRAAALNALTGELIDGIAANTTFETAEANAMAKLTPIFGVATATKLVNFASATSLQLVSELTVLYLLDDDIDVSAEANRIFLSQFAAAIGNETEDLIKPMGDHVSRVVGDLVETGIATDWDDDELESTLTSSLAPVVADWLAGFTPDGSRIEMMLLGYADQIAGLDDTPDAIALQDYIDAKTLEFKVYLNQTLGFELFDLDE